MKTSFTVVVETSNMAPMYDSDDPSEFTKEHEITTVIEEQLHKAIYLWAKQNLEEEALSEVLLNGYVRDSDLMPVEGFSDLSDYGTMKVTLLSKDNKDVESETLVDIIRPEELPEELPEEVTPEDVQAEIEEEQSIPPMSLDDGTEDEEEEGGIETNDSDAEDQV